MTVAARDEELAHAVAGLLKGSGYPSATFRVDPWVRNEDADQLAVYVWVDPEGPVREMHGKGRLQETCKTLVSFVRRIDKPEQFSEMLCASEGVIDFEFTDDRVEAGGITWTHRKPNVWRARYVQDGLRQDPGRRNVSGPFVSIMEIPFWRAY